MIELIIAGIGVVASVFVAYHVAQRATRAEEEKGKAFLKHLSQRYFMSFLNTFDRETNQIRNDSLSKAQYLAELDSILEDFSTLATNPFYVRLLAREPLATKCLVQARRERIEHQLSSTFALNIGTAKGFAVMYRAATSGSKEPSPIEEIVKWVESQK